MVAVPLTVCISAALVDPLLAESPLYLPAMVCMPGARLLVAQSAVNTLHARADGTELQRATGLPPSVNFTVPVGLLPATLSVKLTRVQTDAGLIELSTVVLVTVP